MVLLALSALALLAVMASLTVYSRRRANALLESKGGSDVSASDRISFAEYYRPMARILDSRELEAARSLSGLSGPDYARFRAARLAAFRSYLNEMRLDFNRIEFKLRYLLLSASEEDAELVVRLSKYKSSFQVSLLRVEMQLVLFRLGWSTVDVAPLVAALDSMQAPLVRRPMVSAAGAF